MCSWNWKNIIFILLSSSSLLNFIYLSFYKVACILCSTLFYSNRSKSLDFFFLFGIFYYFFLLFLLALCEGVVNSIVIIFVLFNSFLDTILLYWDLKLFNYSFILFLTSISSFFNMWLWGCTKYLLVLRPHTTCLFSLNCICKMLFY